LAALGLPAVLSTPALAGVSINCLVSYQASDGFYSEYQPGTVSFMTGFELREATGSLRYDWDDIYALIPLGADNIAVVDLETAFALAGPAELDLDSLKAIFDREAVLTGSQRFTPENRRWRIKAREADGDWIDPRIE
jgi:hypothetical protein